MDYPEDFSAQARARVETEKIQAERELRKERDHWRKSQEIAQQIRHERPKPAPVQTLLHNYVGRVFLAFVEEACVLGHKGVWTVDRGRSECDEFLMRIENEAYNLADDGQLDSPAPQQSSDGQLQRLLARESLKLKEELGLRVGGRRFKNSPQWAKYEEMLLAVAMTQGQEEDCAGSGVYPDAMSRKSKASSRVGAAGDPEVAKRRSLVKANPSVCAKDMCETLDRACVPLPAKWQDAGFKGWGQAYKSGQHQPRIRVLISKDRRAT